jgi:O-glycosyl hydrolase
MKKLFYYLLFVIGLVLSMPSIVIAQDTSFETSFEEGEPTGNWYSWAAGFSVAFSDGEMTISYDKNEEAGNQWDRLILWVKPFDLSESPFISFTAKSDAERNSVITLKDDNDASENLSFVLPGDNEFHSFFFHLTDLESEIDLRIINEIQFDIGGYGLLSGTVVMDDFKLGSAAAPAIKAPSINPVENMVLQTGAAEQTLQLTGIFDGDGTTGPVEITATTDNEELITRLNVDYNTPDSTGVLRFTPAPGATGEAIITITLTDAGEMLNSSQIFFEVKVGDFGNTGFAYYFDEGQLPEGIGSTSQYATSLENEALKVQISKNNRWSGFYWDLGNSYDISENPYVNLMLKTNTDQVLQLFLVDIFGNGYEAELLTTQFVFHELVAGKNEFRQNRLYAGENYADVTFDFTGADVFVVDLTNITGIHFVSNGTALNLTGTYNIDEIRMGDQAIRKAYVGQIPSQSFYRNAVGKQKILVPEIKNAASIELSGGEELIENVTVEEITYIGRTENGKKVSYGYTYIEFELVAGAAGSDEITLTAKGNEGYADHESVFSFTVTENNPPEISKPEDMVVQTGLVQTVHLSGINDGENNVEQSLEITAGNKNPEIIGDISVDYESPGKYGQLNFTAFAAGEDSVFVKVADDEGAYKEVAFAIKAYASLNNPPVIDSVKNISVMNNEGAQILSLTGIHDGDDGTQQLTIEAKSSSPEIIPDPAVNYEQGSVGAELVLEPQVGQTGDVIIEITVYDDGGTSENDGDKSTVIQFQVRVMTPPLTGFEFDLDDPETLNLFKPEGAGTVYTLAVVDTLGSKALRIKMKDKWTYAGIWTDIPEVLDLTDFPVISYEILSIDNSTWHWSYFYDMHGADASINRNVENSEAKQYEIPANEWTTITFDYRYPGDLNNSEGNTIDAGKINAVLFNMHDSKPRWPFTNYSGTVYLRNIKVGDLAEFGPLVSSTTIDMVPEQAVYLEDGKKYVQLTGISNGTGSTDGVTVSATSTQPDIVPEPKISQVQSDGTALLTFKPEQTGTSNIRITVEAEGAEPVTVGMLVRVVEKDPETFSVVNINRSEKRQTIHGLGAFQNERRWSDLYAVELGASAMRIGIIGNQWEPVNDNNNPDVINMDGFNYDAFDWAYFRELKEMGVETFILTSWSPPAWMKRNLSLDHREQAVVWENTDNILEPYFYEEFAESMAALVRAFKEEAGIDLKAIGLQNEPFFNEPYSSAILSGPRFAELIEVLGNRFAREGIDHVGFFMPEQVFGSQWGSYSNEGYLNSLRQNPVADSYTNYFAVHGYDGTGIVAGFPSYSNWTSLHNLAQQGDYPKELWMTETHIGYEGWNSAMQLAGAIHGSLWAGNISLWTNWSFGDMQLTNNVPNSSFYTSMNYFKYIRPGAVRVESSFDHPDILATAFENLDGRFAVVLINKGNAPVSLKLEGDDLPPVFESYRTSLYENFVNTKTDVEEDGLFLLPPSSVTTLVTSNIFIGAVNNVTVAENSGQINIGIEKITNAQGTTEGLTLSFDYTNEELFSQINLSEISENGTATIDFTPAADTVGFSEVTLTLTDKNGNSKQVEFFINVVAVPVSADPDLFEGNVKIYPNPAETYVMIEIGNKNFSRIILSDLNGRSLMNTQINAVTQKINLEGLQKGIYFIRLSGEDGHVVRKLIIN